MRLAVTGIGAVTPIGLDVITTAAAFRAGFHRFKPEFSMQAQIEEFDSAPIVVSSMSPYLDGYYPPGKWVMLALACLEDMLAQSELPDNKDRDFWENTGLVIIAPYLHDDRFEWAEKEDDYSILLDSYLPDLLSHLSPGIVIQNSFVVGKSESGFSDAVLLADKIIESGQCERVILVGADSFSDPLSLKWLVESSRLKTQDTPAGLIPGEAAACIMLESEVSASRRNAIVDAYVNNSVALKETNAYCDENLSDGSTYAQAITHILNGVEETVGDIYINVNGENWCANEWANVKVKLSHTFNLAQVSEHYLASSFGDIGAAYGPLSLCLAVRSFKRGYSVCDSALICSNTIHGDISAVLAYSA